MSKAQQALDYSRSKVGGRYSQDAEKRYRNNPFTRDCSSFMYSSWEAAGVKLVDKDTGAKVDNSSTEPYAKGFELLFPDSYSKIGKSIAPSSMIKSLRAGDMLFYATRTDRANRIGHVAMVVGDGRIVHARNPELGIRYDPISYMQDKICAIIRYKEAVPVGDGWNQVNGKWRYIKGGKVLTGWQKLVWSGGTDYFYFDTSGYMITGWVKWKEHWYYLMPKDGNMAYNCGVQDAKDKSKLWWLGTDGKMYANPYRLILT